MIEDFSEESLRHLVNHKIKIESQGRIYNGIVAAVDESYIYLNDSGTVSRKIRISIDDIDAIHFPAKITKVDY